MFGQYTHMNRTRCQSFNNLPPASPSPTPAIAPPPAMLKSMTTEERMWHKVKTQPLVPIGCMVTAYFLASGIRSFQRRDPVTSQRMMRNRVIAQFVTVICFIGYMGLEQADFRLAPMVQDKLNAEKLKQKQEKPNTTSTTSE